MIRKFVFTILSMPIALLFALFLLLIIYPVFNDITANKFKNQFFDHPLPPHTSIVESKSTVGKLNGNGNGIDFFACYLIKSSLSIDELQEYYLKEEFKHAKDGKNPVRTEVLKVSSDSVESEYLERGKLTFKTLMEVENFTGYYFVTLYDGGYSTGFDLRGH